MKIKILFSALIAAAALTFTSCDKDKAEPVAPIFDRVTLTPNPCHPGDSVVAEVTYLSPGQYYYFFQQDLSVGGLTKISVDKGHCTGTNNNPKIRFKAPKQNGMYKVTFSSTVSFTAGSVLYGTTNSVDGILTVKD
ncbi:MAG: hypothetical protein MJZ36_06035 [Bacteroidaceae bacterium]|nr:hypothetical protein [Bacteroidaceae bacterium]